MTSVDTVTISEDGLLLETAEGRRKYCSLDVLDRVMAADFPPDTTVYPDGIKLVMRRGPLSIVVHESKPHVRRVPSYGAYPAPSRRLSLPHIITIMAIEYRNGYWHLVSTRVHCSNESIQGLDHTVYLPPFPHVSIGRHDSYKDTGTGGSNVCLSQNHFSPYISNVEWSRIVERVLGMLWNSRFFESTGWATVLYRGTEVRDFATWERATTVDPRFIDTIEWQHPERLGTIIDQMFNRWSMGNRSLVKKILIAAGGM